MKREIPRPVAAATFLEQMFRDLRHAVRTLWRSPMFTAAAILTLALGVGANTAIFSVVNAVMLKPLPFDDPDRLVRIYESNLEIGRPGSVSDPNFLWSRSGLARSACGSRSARRERRCSGW